jgi:ABC-type transport system substrate-binding protein
VITRRQALGGAVSGALALPSLARAEAARILRMVPQANLASFDPIHSTANITRNYGFMVYDTLYGMSSALEPSPQMAAGHTVEADGRIVVITLRDGLKFHDGEPVLAADAVASLQRWHQRNPLGQKLATVLDGIDALDDRRLRISLKRPFPMLFHGLAGLSQPPFIMPARVAQSDPYKAIETSVGSGPFRFKRDEFNSGSLVVFERNPAYVPAAGSSSLTAGGKTVHFDRVEWRIIPEAGTAAAALQSGEIDWFEQPPPELQGMLAQQRRLKVEPIDVLPNVAVLRLNWVQPPFDNAALRRALYPAIDQADYMTAVVGPDPALYMTGVGAYTPGTPYASKAGLDRLLAPRSVERSREAMRAAGYTEARMRLIGPTDILAPSAITQVAADMFRRLGFNMDLALSDWGTVVQRRNNKGPLDKGGWSALLTSFSSFDCAIPGTHPLLRGNGEQGWVGWPTIPELETLRDAWFDAQEPSEQHRLADEMQRAALDTVAFIPVGAYLQPTALRRDLVDRVPGFAIFWGIKTG